MEAYDNDDMDSLEFASDLSFNEPLPPIPPETTSSADLTFLKPMIVPEESPPKKNETPFVQTSKMDSDLKKKLSNTLDLLPVQMQEMLGDKMVATITNSEIFKTNITNDANSDVI